MLDKTKIKTKGKTYEFGHDKTGRRIKVTKMDGKEVSREFTGTRLIMPQAVGTANFGIKQFKREHPDATHAEIEAFKRGAWEYPPAQMFIESTAMKEKKGKK